MDNLPKTFVTLLLLMS